MKAASTALVSTAGLLLGCVHASEPEGAPLSPNYCAHGACLDISQLSRADVRVESVGSLGWTTISIQNELGATSLRLGVDDDGCVVTPILKLERRKVGQYVGIGCLMSPASKSGKKVEVRFEPKVLPREGERPDGFPVSALWSVDESPVSFWERGYTLRLGPALRLEW